MRNLLGLSIIVVLLISTCSSSETSNYKFTYELLDDDETGFGYIHYDDVEDIGPNSIFLKGPYCYILDPVFSNIKRIDIRSGEKKCSLPINAKGRLWFRDLVVDADSIYVLSDLDKMYVFDLGLNISRVENLRRGEKYFWQDDEHTFIYYYGEEKILPLNARARLEGMANKYIPIFDSSHGKKYKISDGGKKISMPTWTINIGESFHTDNNLYSMINISYDDNSLVYFNIVKNRLVLNVYIW